MRTSLLVVLPLAAGLHGIAMNFSAEKASRKWPCAGLACGERPMVTVAAILLMLCAQIAPAAAARKSGAWSRGAGSELSGERGPKLSRTTLPASVPLPKARPADAPAADPDKSGARNQTPGEPTKQAAPAAPPPPSACRLALTEEIAIAPSIPDIRGPGDCGGEDLVRLEAVVLPDKRRVTVKPAAIMRCTMASAIADWIRIDMAPLALSLGSVVSDLDNFDSFECRGLNGIAGAQLSEHGHANALDVRALKLANGQSISFTDRTVAREVRENILHSVCARFSTVLGPGADGYHEDHIHLDLMQRHNNYKICQWNVWDPLPQIAPLLPAARPEEAPPRQVAAKSDPVKPDPAEKDAAKSEASKPESAGAKPSTGKPSTGKLSSDNPSTDTPSTGKASADTPPTKKRRQDRRF